MCIGVNGGVDKGCEELSNGGGLLARVQSGRVPELSAIAGAGGGAAAAILIWSSRG